MRSLESRRHRALDDVSDNEHLGKEFRRKMANAGPLIFNDQAEDEMQIREEMEMFSERDAGKATIDVSTEEKQAVEEQMIRELEDIIERINEL